MIQCKMRDGAVTSIHGPGCRSSLNAKRWPSSDASLAFPIIDVPLEGNDTDLEGRAKEEQRKSPGPTPST